MLGREGEGFGLWSFFFSFLSSQTCTPCASTHDLAQFAFEHSDLVSLEHGRYHRL